MKKTKRKKNGWFSEKGKIINNYKIIDVWRDVDKKITYLKFSCCNCGKTYSSSTTNFSKQKPCECSASLLEKHPKVKDVRKEKFGKLTPIELVGVQKDGSGNAIWRCRCDCGKECNVLSSSLRNKITTSCGCVAKEAQKETGKKIEKITKDYCVAGTNVRNLTAKVREGSVSGVKGVTWDKSRNKWIAQIGFRGKHYNLGRFSNLEDAIEVRKKAEKEIFGDFLTWFSEEFPERWEKMKKKNI